MPSLIKPMLAVKLSPKELAQVRYPVLLSPKLDGIRMSTQQTSKKHARSGLSCLARSLKDIPNRHVQDIFSRKELAGLDGELIVGSPNDPDCFKKTTSVVMSHDGDISDLRWWVFDMLPDYLPPARHSFSHRTMAAQHHVARAHMEPFTTNLRVKYLDQQLIVNEKQLQRAIAEMDRKGYEGVVMRDPQGSYKQGRSTLREFGMVAIKHFVDAEAVIIGVYEQEANTNVQTKNELGKSTRSSAKAGKVGKGTLGGFTVAKLRDGFVPSAAQAAAIVIAGEHNTDVFNVATGPGLTAALRDELWKKRKSLLGKLIKFKYQLCGTDAKPRIPLFLGFRDPRDL